MMASAALKDARFWGPEDPYLYDVYTILTRGRKGRGRQQGRHRISARREFKGGAGSGGVYLNDSFVYLKGFAQRSSNEWAGLGQAYPDWMHDFRRN